VTVHFDANGGSGSMSDETSLYDTAKALTSNSFTKTGYSFSGWNTQANGSGTAYADGATYDFTADATLYAQWKILTFTLNYSVGTGGWISGTTYQTVNYGANGTPVTIAPKTGYYFVKWSDGVLNNPRQDLHVIANINVQAIFATGTERLTNGRFNTYNSSSKIPSGWTAVNFSNSDGKDTSIKKEGAASVKVSGQTGKTKTLTQTITLSGATGNTFTLSFWIKTSAVPTTGICQAQVLFYSRATLKAIKNLMCPAGSTYDWKQASLSFTAPASYTSIKVIFTYSKASGTVWFDAASLIK
jgi:uncharacterized repeat protein (TIGR02543 family)